MAGKSSTAKALVKRLQTEGVAIELLKETTTRPKRESDYFNPEYYFVTEEEYNQKDFLVSVDFNVASGEIWRYGIETQNFPSLGIIVSNMYAIDSLLKNPLPKDLEVTIIYLNISEQEVLRRDKGDRVSQSGDDVSERVKRDISNYNELAEKWQDYIYNLRCDNLPLEDVIDCICNILKQKSKY
jgi:guanylate kinase